MVSRTGDFALYNRFFTSFGKTQALYDKTSIQISTGERATSYAEISGDTNRLLRAENALMKFNQYRENINGVDLRVNSMDSTMTKIVNVATELRTLLTSATNADNYAEFDVESQARNLMETLAGLMNTQTDGQYLLSGTLIETNTLTIPDPLTAPSNNGGVGGDFIPFDRTTLDPVLNPVEYAEYFGYYNGNNEIQQVRTDSDQVIDYGITGNNDAFVQLQYAMTLASTFDGTGEEADRLETALEFTINAIEDLVNVQGGLGQKIKIMNTTKGNHEESIFLMSDIIAGIESTNITEAVARLSQYETTLQASYLTLSKVSELSIINYIR